VIQLLVEFRTLTRGNNLLNNNKYRRKKIMEANNSQKKGGVSIVFVGIGAALLLIATIGSTFFLSSKIEKSNEKIVVVDKDSQDRDTKLDQKIEAVNDSIVSVNLKMAEIEKNLNGKIWYLQKQVDENKQKVEDLNIVVEELKIQPVVTNDEPVKTSSKKKKRSSGFDFSELESMGEEFETMFE
jgi:hypothetical protein